MTDQQHSLDITVEDITPDIAASYLTKNVLNRNVRRKAVEALSRDMKAGRWRLTGQGISFDTEGHLKDGQHRLTAILESGVTVTMMVVRGVEPDAQAVMDVGRARSYADKLKLQGEANCTSLASSVRVLTTYLADGWNNNEAFTFGELDETLRAHPGIREANSVVMGTVKSRLRGFRPTSLTLAWYVTRQTDFDGERATGGQDHEFFWQRARDGQSLVEGDPIYALRRLNERVMEGATVIRSQHVQYGLLIKAWNAYRLGEKKALLIFRPGGANPEKTPIPV